MILCRVVGRSWATIKHPVYVGRIVFAVEPVEPDGSPKGPSFLAVDDVGAGPGEVVLVSREGNAARQLLGQGQPVHSVILGIVDEVNTEAGVAYTRRTEVQ